LINRLFYDENAPNAIVSYYTKGALLAFVLDIEIRKRTDDKHSLDDVLRLIWDNYQATGLEDDTVQTVIKHLTQSDFTQFFDAYLYGVDELPLKEAFAYVGVCQKRLLIVCHLIVHLLEC
jgi:predicted metalloprotease with PDZ domain